MEPLVRTVHEGRFLLLRHVLTRERGREPLRTALDSALRALRPVHLFVYGGL